MSFLISDYDAEIYIHYWRTRLIKQLDRLEIQSQQLGLRDEYEIISDVANDIRIALIKDTNNILSKVRDKGAA